jgi:hypothetical protein
MIKYEKSLVIYSLTLRPQAFENSSLIPKQHTQTPYISIFSIMNTPSQLDNSPRMYRSLLRSKDNIPAGRESERCVQVLIFDVVSLVEDSSNLSMTKRLSVCLRIRNGHELFWIGRWRGW